MGGSPFLVSSTWEDSESSHETRCRPRSTAYIPTIPMIRVLSKFDAFEGSADLTSSGEDLSRGHEMSRGHGDKSRFSSGRAEGTPYYLKPGSSPDHLGQAENITYLSPAG